MANVGIARKIMPLYMLNSSNKFARDHITSTPGSNFFRPISVPFNKKFTEVARNQNLEKNSVQKIWQRTVWALPHSLSSLPLNPPDFLHETMQQIGEQKASETYKWKLHKLRPDYAKIKRRSCRDLVTQQMDIIVKRKRTIIPIKFSSDIQTHRQKSRTK